MLVPGDAMRISTQCEEYVCRPDVKWGFDATGEFSAYYNGELLDWSRKNHWNRRQDHTDREDCNAHAKTQVQETFDREDHPHKLAQQILEKPNQVEN